MMKKCIIRMYMHYIDLYQCLPQTDKYFLRLSLGTQTIHLVHALKYIYIFYIVECMIQCPMHVQLEWFLSVPECLVFLK